MENRKRIAILFSGKGSNFAHIVNTLHHKKIDVVVALTNNSNAEGIAVAQMHHIPLEIVDSSLYKKREDFDTEVVKILKKYKPDLTVLAGFMRILTTVFTEQVKAINLHPSLLPRHKGLQAIEKSYKDEHDEGGVTVHYVSNELDGGKVVLRKEIFKEGLNFTMYNKKIRNLEKEAIEEAILEIILEKESV